MLTTMMLPISTGGYVRRSSKMSLSSSIWRYKRKRHF